MELSVEVKRLNGNTFYICRGQLLNGCASEYLFDLLTRPDAHDAVVDLAEVTAVDDDGFLTLALSCQVLAASRRRLFFRNAPSHVVGHLHAQHGATVLEWPSARSIASPETFKSVLTKQAFGGR